MLIGGILIARSHLSLDDVGALEWLIFIGYGLTFFWMAALLQMFLTYSGTHTSIPGDEIRRGIPQIIFLMGPLVVLICTSIGYLMGNRYGLSSFHYLLYGVWIGGSLGGMFLPYWYYARQRFTAMYVASFTLTLVYVAIFFISMIVQVGLDGILVMLSVFGLITWLTLLFHIPDIRSFESIRSRTIVIVKKVYPLAVYTFLGGAAILIDTLLVHYYFGEGDLMAIFKYGSRELPITLVFSAAFSNAILPYISREGKSIKGLDKLKIRSGQLMHYLFSITILLLLSSDMLFNFLYGSRFQESVILFDCMLLVVIARSIFPQTIIIGLQRNEIMHKVGWLEFILNAILSVILMYWIGLLGIVMATVIAYTFEKLYLAIQLKKHYNLSWQQYSLPIPYILWSTGLIAIFVLKHLYWSQ